MTGTTEHSTVSLSPRRVHVARDAGPAERHSTPDCAAADAPAWAQPLPIHANVLWTFLGNLVYAISRWGMVVVLAKLSNSETIGLVIMAFALGAPLYSFTNLGLRSALVTDMRGEFAFQDYLGLRLLSAVLAVLLVGVMVWGMGYGTELLLLTLLAGLGKSFESISDIIHGLLQRRERMDRIGIALVMREPAAVLLLAGAVYLTGNVVWGMIGFPLAMAVTLLFYDIPNGAKLLNASAGDRPSGTSDRLVPRWNLHTMGRLAWLCAPLGVIMLMITLIVNIPRYAVEHYLGTGSLGVFASITYISAGALTLVSAIGQSASPRLAKHYADKEVGAYCVLLGRLLVTVGAVGFGLAGLMAVAGGTVLRLLYGPDLVGYTSLAVYLLLASAVNNLCGPLGRAVDATRQFWIHMFIRIVGILVLAGLLPVLVPRHGLEGVAAAIFLSTGVSLLLYVGVLAATLMRLGRGRKSERRRGFLLFGGAAEGE